MKLNAIACFTLSLSTLVLTSLPTLAQTNAKPLTDWSQFANTEKEFMQGCMGQKKLSPVEKRIKQNFCQCAFNAYKTRYTPQIFTQINALALQTGENGPRLVNLMMKPEIDRCSTLHNYRP